MLTSDLAINWRRGDKIFPRLIRPRDAGFLRDAENLIAIFEDFVDKTRRELEAELEEYVGTGTDYRILRRLYQTARPTGANLKRRASPNRKKFAIKFFSRRAKFQPVLPDSARREEILQTVAEEFETDWQAIFSNLYADLSGNQKLISFESITPEDLLDRYNLAQAQALLYKCVELKIRVAPVRFDKLSRDFRLDKTFRLDSFRSGKRRERLRNHLNRRGFAFSSLAEIRHPHGGFSARAAALFGLENVVRKSRTRKEMFFTNFRASKRAEFVLFRRAAIQKSRHRKTEKELGKVKRPAGGWKKTAKSWIWAKRLLFPIWF